MSKDEKNIARRMAGADSAHPRGVFLTDSAGQSESIQELMRDAVLHDGNQIDLFGLRVNPGLISAFTVTALLS